MSQLTTKVQPGDINIQADRFFCEAGVFTFGPRVEKVSVALVRLAQERGAWSDFERKDVLPQHPPEQANLIALIAEARIGVRMDGILFYTDAFIEACYEASPAEQEDK